MNLFASITRTVVPVLVGLVLTFAAQAGLDLDGEAVTMVATAVVIAAYYAVFRLLEALAGRLGWRPLQLLAGVLLGWARPPSYGSEGELPPRAVLDPKQQSALAALKRASGGTRPR
ncbi:hypothetical protein ACF08A_25570 [Streptomyces cellulosae]